MCSIYFKNKVVARTFLIDDLYHLHMDASVNINEQIVNAIGSKRLRDRSSQKYLWHLRLGHIVKGRKQFPSKIPRLHLRIFFNILLV